MSEAARSGWRFFPYAMVGSIGLMVVIDSGLAWTALRSFPGLAATDVFDHSNLYDQVLDIAAREAQLGWTVAGTVENGQPLLALTDRAGQPLRGLRIEATAERPLGAANITTPSFREVAPGRYLATVALPLPGQWDLKLALHSETAVLHATRRVIVK